LTERTIESQSPGFGSLTVLSRVVGVNDIVVAHGPGVVAIVEIQVQAGEQRFPAGGKCPAQFAAGAEFIAAVAVIAAEKHILVSAAGTGHAHLQEVGRIVKEAVREAGGIPFEFNTIGVDDGIIMGLFFIMTRGGPAGRTELLGLLMERVGFRGAQVGVASAISIVMLITVFAVVIGPALRISRERLEYS